LGIADTCLARFYYSRITGSGGTPYCNCASLRELEPQDMAEKTKSDKVTLEELMVSTLAMPDAAVKLLIQKGIITDAESKPN
jgi:hypothetical protein